MLFALATQNMYLTAIQNWLAFCNLLCLEMGKFDQQIRIYLFCFVFFLVLFFLKSKIKNIAQNISKQKSQTVMIAAVSPSAICKEDTLNTLKYADRAKQIKCSAEQNVAKVEDRVQDYGVLISKLRDELKEWRERALAAESGASSTTSTTNAASSSTAAITSTSSTSTSGMPPSSLAAMSSSVPSLSSSLPTTPMATKKKSLTGAIYIISLSLSLSLSLSFFSVQMKVECLIYLQLEHCSI